MAARDYVTVANLATGFFGEDDQIRSAEEDSKPARTIRAVWDEIRKFVLAKANWNFAMGRAELAARVPSAQYPVIDYSYAFPVPADFRRLVDILEPKFARDSFEIVSGPKGLEILANTAGPLAVKYVRDVEDPARWSDEFTETFAMRLAWQIADRLSGDKQRKEQANNAYKEALRLAKRGDATQNPPMRHVETDWAAARRTGIDRAPGIA